MSAPSPPRSDPVRLAAEPDFALGELAIHPSVREVVRDGRRHQVEPRVMQVLVALARANGAVVSRDELIHRCWDDRVVGEAAKPQFLPYKQQMTLLDVMIAVGGLTDFAAGNSATILRTAEGNKQYSVRLKDLIKRGDVSANVEMRPGDILIIPQSLF